MLDLNKKRQDIITVATELFEKFVNMPKDVRPDNKERTGIQVFVWKPGTRNLVLVSVKEPPEAVKFFAIEKAVRANVLLHMSSESSANPSLMRFPGSVSISYLSREFADFCLCESVLISSTSGLTPEEDVAVSVSILADILGLSFLQACESIVSGGGELPDWYKKEDKGYFQFLFE